MRACVYILRYRAAYSSELIKRKYDKSILSYVGLDLYELRVSLTMMKDILADLVSPVNTVLEESHISPSLLKKKSQIYSGSCF